MLDCVMEFTCRGRFGSAWNDDKHEAIALRRPSEWHLFTHDQPDWRGNRTTC